MNPFEIIRRKSPGEIHHIIYLFLLTGIVACMPLSKYITSLFQIVLIIHWLARGDYRMKWDRLKSRKAIWVLSLFFIIPLIGMIYTADWSYGIHDLKIKIPLLAMPLVIGTSETISRRNLKLILLVFVASVSISSLVSLLIVFEIIPYAYTDVRETSLFISHIRLALLVDMSVFILSFYALRRKVSTWERLGIFAWAAYLIVYLVAVKALTGLVVGLLVGFVLCLRWILKLENFMLKWFSIVALLTVPVLVSLYISSQVSGFYTINQDMSNLDKTTVNGNPYWHDTTNLHLENGYYTGLYICEMEMRPAWNRISDYDYDGQDDKGHELRYTLIRYLTSKGLRKDAYGISQLTPDDINLIEQGYANHIYLNRKKFSVRIYELIWEIDVYRKGGNPSGHSVTQRIEYLKTGLRILADQPFTGVGTGDVPSAFENKYQEINTQLDPEWRLRAHNQWLTFAISFGLPGAFILLLAFILPGFLQKKYSHYFFLLFIMVSFLSMFNEDTLETQAGVAFFAFFYPFILFSPDHEE